MSKTPREVYKETMHQAKKTYNQAWTNYLETKAQALKTLKEAKEK